MLKEFGCRSCECGVEAVRRGGEVVGNRAEALKGMEDPGGLGDERS